MADPTEAAAEAATQFRSEISKGGVIRPVQVGDLIRSLTEEVKGFSPSERETYLETLASYVETVKLEAPEAENAAVPASLRINKDVARRMNMSAESDIPPEKADLLFTRSLLFMLLVDQLVWAVWKNIAPASKIKRETKGSPSLPTVLRQFIGEQSELSEEDVLQTFEKTRQLAAGLLGALGPIGRNYGTKTRNKFNPDSIKDLVAKEGGKGETRLWQKFEELFHDLNEEIVEQDIHRAIVKYTEDLLKGSRI
jgi:hypothetical protein